MIAEKLMMPMELPAVVDAEEIAARLPGAKRAFDAAIASINRRRTSSLKSISALFAQGRPARSSDSAGKPATL
jgi:hypothetical protein